MINVRKQLTIEEYHQQHNAIDREYNKVRAALHARYFTEREIEVAESKAHIKEIGAACRTRCAAIYAACQEECGKADAEYRQKYDALNAALEEGVKASSIAESLSER